MLVFWAMFDACNISLFIAGCDKSTCYLHVICFGNFESKPILFFDIVAILVCLYSQGVCTTISRRLWKSVVVLLHFSAMTAKRL